MVLNLQKVVAMNQLLITGGVKIFNVRSVVMQRAGKAGGSGDNVIRQVVEFIEGDTRFVILVIFPIGKTDKVIDLHNAFGVAGDQNRVVVIAQLMRLIFSGRLVSKAVGKITFNAEDVLEASFFCCLLLAVQFSRVPWLEEPRAVMPL